MPRRSAAERDRARAEAAAKEEPRVLTAINKKRQQEKSKERDRAAQPGRSSPRNKKNPAAAGPGGSP